MANAFNISNVAAKASLDAFTTTLDAGSPAAIIRGYSGTMPTDTDTALSGNTVLFELTFSATSFPAAADLNPGARITANSITADSSADNTGTCTFFRFLTQTSSGTAVAQGTAGVSSADLILNTVSITSGSTVSVTSVTVTLLEGP